MANLIKKYTVFLVILFLSSYLRFNNISSVTTVGGDQGYDFLQIYKMVSERNLTLLGPKIGPYNEIGNLYLGPAYYYILTPSLILSGFDPIGSAVLSATLSILTVVLVYITAYRFFNPTIAVLAALIYGLSPLAIRQSQAASNPHLLPFFGALIVFGILTTRKRKPSSTFWPVVVGLASGISFQLHYLALTIFLVSLLFFINRKRQLVILLLSFVAAIFPQIIFEFRHSFFITNIFLNQMSLGGNLNTSNHFFWQLIGGLKVMLKFFLGINFIYFLPVLIFVLIKILLKRNDLKFVLALNLGIFVSSLVIASLYSGGFGVHYMAVSYPSFVLLMGASFYYGWRMVKNNFLKFGIGILMAQIIAATIMATDLHSEQGYTMPEGWNLKGLRKASEIIVDEIDKDTFNVASVLEGDTRAMSLRYLVTIKKKIPEPVENYSDIGSLFLLTKDDNERVLNYTVWEVSNYQPFVITKSWDIQNNIRLLKLEKKNDDNI